MDTQWEYSGDVNVEYGGQWMDMSTFDDGYVTAVRVTDLDDGCGFDGAVLIEHVVILCDKGRWKDAMRCCGYSVWDILGIASEYRRQHIAESCLAYGYYDPDDGWDGYKSYWQEVIQVRNDGPMEFDGWKADKRVLSENLEGYIKAVHLRG